MVGHRSDKDIFRRFAIPRKDRHADSLAQSSPQILKSGLKRIKLICTSENESKDQIGDSCAIFVTVLHKDAKKFCLTNIECIQANKTAVNPSKICCKSTFAKVFDRHPQKKLIIRFRHVVKVFRLNNSLIGSNVCLLLHAGL